MTETPSWDEIKPRRARRLQQTRMLQLIRESYHQKYRPPTILELAADMKLSKSTAFHHVRQLAAAGAIEIDNGHIRLVVKTGDPCPFCGETIGEVAL